MIRLSCRILFSQVLPIFFVFLFISNVSWLYAATEPSSKSKSIKIQSIEVVPEQLTASDEAEIDKMVLPVFPNWTGDFDGMRKERVIRILVPYSKTFFSVDRGRQHGIDYDFGMALHKWVNQKYPPKKKGLELHVMFIPVKRDQLLPALLAGKGDIAAGGLTVTEGRKQTVDFAYPFAAGVREALVTIPYTPLQLTHWKTFLEKKSPSELQAAILNDKYLKNKELTPVNRTLMAFAAYNAGPGNLRKFRSLAKKSGNDPNIWFQNVEYAAARIVGQETVQYVANIYKYYLAYKLVEAKSAYSTSKSK